MTNEALHELAARVEAAEGAVRADGTKSRLHRRVEAARDLAEDFVIDGQFRAAQIIRDLCASAVASSNTNAQLHRDLQTALRALSTKDPTP